MNERNPANHNSPRSYYARAAILLLFGVVIGLGVSAGLDLKSPAPVHQQPAIAASTAAAQFNGDYQSPFTAVVERALPAVVFVEVRKKTGSDDRGREWLWRFFGDQPRRQQRQAPNSGSGFIIDQDGHVLTNNHVVRDADDITVTRNDGVEFKATVVGTDPETDVAVIKIQADGHPVLPLGDSDGIRVGDWAIAIGNPLGQLRGSVTVGIISAQGRSDLNIYGGTPSFQDFIQTDASINFGNSGGPLCNIRGEVIGINTAINPSGQGIGFAIPINMAKHVSDQLIASGEVKRAMLGVYLAELTPELAEGFGLDGVDGVLIQRVIEGSPADQAGVKRNDVVIEFDGNEVTDLQKFRFLVAETKIGKTVPVTVLRGGKRRTVNVKLAARDQNLLAQNQPQVEEPSETEALAGLQVRELTAEEAEAANVESGVLVTGVKEGSISDESGIQPGDVIEEVGGRPCPTANAFVRRLEDARDRKRPAVLLVNSEGQTRFVALRIE